MTKTNHGKMLKSKNCWCTVKGVWLKVNDECLTVVAMNDCRMGGIISVTL